ncbi:hypothetical protein B0A50_03444 [Salinomyces thailandicus]|uniref:Spindle pole body component n=1 Tax=Salinomyces thailandicus TaxID=706561 RepID=A0A4U0U4H2_9PEZI|nr:hypothetical protein B0A50_03444 [Salinomyces thailandica]
MAHTARLGELAGGLTTAITGVQEGDSALRVIKDTALKGLRVQTHARTNHFAVRDRYAGLVEKLTVRNRDDVADALQVRLAELGIDAVNTGKLDSQSKWLPEVLSLLLELSDRPVEKTNLQDLIRLTKTTTPPPPLTWEDIVADDPLDEDGIWDDVERGYHSSGDDSGSDEGQSEPTTSTAATSVGEDDCAALAVMHLVALDESALDGFKAASIDGEDETSEGAGSPTTWSALMLVRETFMMLHGLPSRTYSMDAVSGLIKIKHDIALETVTRSTLHHTCERLADIGTRLQYLRIWTRRSQKAAYLQSIQSAVEKLLTQFALAINELEGQYITPLHDTVVSIASIRAQAETLSRPLVRLAEVFQHVESTSTTENQAFTILDGLYDEASITQMSGDDKVFFAVVSVLLAGVQTYVRPVRDWAESGTTPSTGANDIFILDRDPNCDSSSVWHQRWTLRTTSSGDVYAPRFMQPFVERIAAQGKAQAFLKLLTPTLEHDMAIYSARTSTILFSPDFNTFLPFAQLFDDSLSSWLEASGSDRTALLRSTLLQEYSLLTTFESLAYVFFAKDGTLFQEFANAVLELIRRRPSTWQDRFILTSLAQSRLGSAAHLDGSSITMTIHETDDRNRRLVIRQLEDLQLHLALPWPVRNITRSNTLPIHAAAFTLLLQTEHASALLRPTLFTLRTLDKRTSSLPAEHHTVFQLRWKLTWFVNAWRAHISTTVASLHTTLLLDIQHAETVDNMAAVWTAYEHGLRNALLLAENLAPMKEAILEILEMSEHFAILWKELFPALSFSDSTASTTTNQGDAQVEEGKAGARVTARLGDFGRSLSFIIAGLRSVSRAGGYAELEGLLQRLEAHPS